MLSSVVASFHYLALALGLGGLFMRGRALKAFGEGAKPFQLLFTADNCFGVAALLWLITGLLRAFGGLEKGTAFYLQNPLFWLKMSVFVLVAFLEIWPMVTFIRWRIAVGRKQEPQTQIAARLYQLNCVSLCLVILMPFIASAMARGIGM